MTNKEAINHINDIICENNTVKHSDMVVFDNEKEALDMAIHAIKKIEKLSIIIKEDLERECLEHDSFDEYSEGRYDILSRLNQIICEV